ncbi:MAG: glycosyltransferase family 39 protein [Chloroflexi bacterium]|nr:glycosyltransferase family 39 protein [Chloroflexota bacterium]
MTTETRHTPLAWLRRHHEVILLGAILLAALALRLYQLEQDSFWIDELTQINHSRVPLLRVFKAALLDDGSTPLDYLVTHFVYYYIGRSEGILRLPAVLWGVLSVATVYFLGKRMFDKTTGFLAAALLAILPSHIYYSQEVRPYSLPALMVLLATFAFYHAVSRNTRGAWALYGITLVIGMYSHYYVAIVGILHGAYLALMALVKRLPWNRLLPYVIAAGAAGLLFLPWVLADQFRSGYAFQMPSKSVLLSAAFVPRGGDALIANFRPLTVFVGFVWACVLVSVGLSIRGGSAARNNMGLLALVVLGGMAVAVVLDYLGSHFFPTRHFLPFAPLLILLGAAGAVEGMRGAARSVRREPTEAMNTLIVVLLVALAAWTLATPISEVYRHKKQDWRGVGRYLLRNVAQGDVVLLRMTFDVEFYAPELKNHIQPLRSLKTIQDAAKAHQRVWIVDWSSALRRYVPDVAHWLEAEKPLRIRGFTSMELYLYSATLTPQQLEATLKQW